MKKISILFSILFLLNMFSCSKDNSTSSTTTNSSPKFDSSLFIGKWKFTKIEINGIDSTARSFQYYPCIKNLLIEFKTNVVSETNVSGCSIKNDRNWKLLTQNNKNLLILIDKNESDTLDIISFSSTTIVINETITTKTTLTKQ